jgi:ribonuclease HI
MQPEVIIYTDGAARGNPGPGGYGIVLKSGNHRKELSQGYKKTTNNRMELLGAIVALESLKKPCKVTLYTDSKYVADAVNKGWVFSWEKVNFKKKKNPDLWKRFLEIYRQHNINFQWVKGHNNNKENEICDRLAVNASKQINLSEDEGYVKQSTEKDENEDFI